MPFDGKNFEKPTDGVLRVLTEARALIERPENWCKNALYENGARCVLGALYNTQSDNSDGWNMPIGAYNAINSAVPGAFLSIPHFNNDPSTTHADVLALFDRAIAARKAEGLNAVEEQVLG